MRVVQVLGVLAAVFISVQCSEQRYARDVSELFSAQNVQSRPIYRPPSAPQEDLGYNYPKPAPIPQPVAPIVRPAPRPEIIVQPQPSYPQPRPVYPQPQPSYPQPQPSYPQPQPSYPQPQPSYPQPQPTYPQPQPSYPQPQPSYPQPRPIPQPQPTYPQPQISYPQPQPSFQPRPVYPQPQPVYQPQPRPLLPQPQEISPPQVLLPSQPEFTTKSSIGYDYPNPYAVDRVQPTGAATGTSEKIFWPFTNKFGPPSNSYPGSNNIGYPNGNYPHKFSFLDNLFPFKNNYNGQRIEAASNQVATTSNLNTQGFNSIGSSAPSSVSGSSGYDYPNPNEQQPPFQLPGIVQFRSQPNRK